MHFSAGEHSGADTESNSFLQDLRPQLPEESVRCQIPHTPPGWGHTASACPSLSITTPEAPRALPSRRGQPTGGTPGSPARIWHPGSTLVAKTSPPVVLETREGTAQELLF